MMDTEQISRLIPHAGSMCLINQVTHADEQSITCLANSHRHPENPLRERGMLNATCGIEYAAQAMAIHGAMQLKKSNDTQDKPRGGRLASVRSVEVFTRQLDTITSDLEIKALQIMGDANSMMYEFTISGDSQVLLQGKATVILVAES